MTNNPIASAVNNTGSAEPTDDGMVPISSLTRTNYVAPVYPRAAQRRNITGSVDLVFTVNSDGRVTEVSVIAAEPSKTFNQAAMTAVSKWEFEPVIENGVAVSKRSAVRLAFDLED